MLLLYSKHPMQRYSRYAPDASLVFGMDGFKDLLRTYQCSAGIQKIGSKLTYALNCIKLKCERIKAYTKDRWRDSLQQLYSQPYLLLIPFDISHKWTIRSRNGPLVCLVHMYRDCTPGELPAITDHYICSTPCTHKLSTKLRNGGKLRVRKEKSDESYKNNLPVQTVMIRPHSVTSEKGYSHTVILIRHRNHQRYSREEGTSRDIFIRRRPGRLKSQISQ